MAPPNPEPHEPNVLESPEAVLSTLAKDGKRRWLYPTVSKGKHYLRRWGVGWLLIVIFVGLPIVPVGGKPALLLDVVHLEFTLLGTTLYATDTLLLMLSAISFLLGIILVTALLGRVWCGWACPQTVYLEFVFRPIEQLIEGKESARRRNDAKPMYFALFMRKALKYSLFFLISLGLAHTFIAYFVGWSSLIRWMTGPPEEHWGFFVMMGVTTALIMFDFAFFREQMCTIACPYARIQSVLQDRDSMIVSYDPFRGEPRGRRSKGGDGVGLGDCIDCGACVRTCPTGIDIRDGLQMECIGCTQCIDACTDIMIAVDKPVGLIRYTSENALESKKSRVVRPRVVLYTALLAVLGGLLLTALLTRDAVDLNITRVPGEPFTVLTDTRVANRLRFRIHNRTGAADTFNLNVEAPEASVITIIGNPNIALDDGASIHVDAWVMVPSAAFTGDSIEGVFVLSSVHSERRRAHFRLLGPSQRGK